LKWGSTEKKKEERRGRISRDNTKEKTSKAGTLWVNLET